MILLCYGTRPEWLKIKPLVKEFNKNNYKLLFTGQHEDLLKETNPDFKIKILKNKNRLDSIIYSCMSQFPSGNFDGVLVQGDTASAFGCALAAYNRKIKIFYLEAGLRTYDLDNPFPEEAYRQMIARISDVNLCPTEKAKNSLINEKVNGQNYVVGNTVLDNLINFKKETTYSNIILVTLHRRENHNLIKKWFKEINKLALFYSEYKFVLPLHPSPSIQKYKNILSNVHVIDPMLHEDFLNLLCKSRLIITDSGGLQEEGSFLNKKIIVCRKTTERPEAISTGHIHLCPEVDDLKVVFSRLINDFKINSDCPFGDGQSAKKIKKIIWN